MVTGLEAGSKGEGIHLGKGGFLCDHIIGIKHSQIDKGVRAPAVLVILEAKTNPVFPPGQWGCVDFQGKDSLVFGIKRKIFGGEGLGRIIVI